MAPKKAAFKATIERLPVKGSMHLIKVPKEISSEYSDRKSVRIFCTIDNKVTYPCALRPDGSGKFFINVATPVLNKGKFKLGQTVIVSIRKDTSEFGHTVPAELTELLSQDKEGKQYWDNLTNGAQRSLIYYISQAKSVDKRIERSLLFINRLKDTKGAWKPGS